MNNKVLSESYSKLVVYDEKTKKRTGSDHS